MRLLCLAILALAGCSTSPVQTAPRPAATIHASLGRTWDAVVDQFGERSIPVRNMERASGFMATQAIATNFRGDDRAKWADCGTVVNLPLPPSSVEYTVLVRGDSSMATVKTTARYVLVLGLSNAPQECVSTGLFENAFESAVRAKAESPH